MLSWNLDMHLPEGSLIPTIGQEISIEQNGSNFVGYVSAVEVRSGRIRLTIVEDPSGFGGIGKKLDDDLMTCQCCDSWCDDEPCEVTGSFNPTESRLCMWCAKKIPLKSGSRCSKCGLPFCDGCIVLGVCEPCRNSRPGPRPIGRAS